MEHVGQSQVAGLEHVVVAVILMGRDDRMKERRGGEGGAKGPKRAEEGEKGERGGYKKGR